MWSVLNCTLHQIKEDEMVGACSMDWLDEIYIKYFR
jgi:hypothetical protein